MAADSSALWLLACEARSLLTRVRHLKPFALQMPMVPAAAFSPDAQWAIGRHFLQRRRVVSEIVHDYLHWITGPDARRKPAAEAQQRYVLLKLKFNALLSQVDIFGDVLTQRSEHDTGVWLAGLDAVAADALALPGRPYRPPPVVCYLDRGLGAAIRRARTRLPGGARNPVAIIRVPRERMIGSGIASSLVHEAGHQGAALLGLPNSLRPVLRQMQVNAAGGKVVWTLWEQWISEILADLWAVSKVAVAATLGLMEVIGLPRPFVFRMDIDDPHPIPWIRLKLNCALGNALYPHPQWHRIARLWESLYPTTRLEANKRALLARLEASMPELVALVLRHRPKRLGGRSLFDVMSLPDRRPDRLAGYRRLWRSAPRKMETAPPSLVFAVVGQAKAHGKMTPEHESQLVASMLRRWALRKTMDAAASHAARSPCLYPCKVSLQKSMTDL